MIGNSSGLRLMILNHADESRMSTSKKVFDASYALLMEAQVPVPTMKIRVVGHFHHHTYLFSLVGG